MVGASPNMTVDPVGKAREFILYILFVPEINVQVLLASAYKSKLFVPVVNVIPDTNVIVPPNQLVDACV
jgi:hypothetical protein